MCLFSTHCCKTISEKNPVHYHLAFTYSVFFVGRMLGHLVFLLRDYTHLWYHSRMLMCLQCTTDVEILYHDFGTLAHQCSEEMHQIHQCARHKQFFIVYMSVMETYLSQTLMTLQSSQPKSELLKF